ncbi:flagellar hook-associated protein FlgL [Paenibacillus sp. UNC451MF]|uniref:flagellar hook-associated protein FlgL n=1 Tax=Paenibacillus sp. UNC451MF TaxID=1449063 RepID=UPI000490093E|nr:flagellar hook-associated protein FlgL [Paenibacillus sp. UNC451MF]
MALRVTQSMMSMQLIRNLNTNTMRMDSMQEQMSTGRRINRPSDDPVGITYSLRYRSELDANDQYIKNVDTSSSWLDFNDTMLDQVDQVFLRATDLATQGATGTNSQAALNSIKSEVDELYKQLVTIGNSKLNGKFVFNGQTTDWAPYTEKDAEKELTDPYEVAFEVGAGIKLPVNLTGNEIFGSPTDPDNAFLILKQLSQDLEQGNTTGVSAALDKISTRMNSIVSTRSEIGARVNRLELVENRLKDIGLNIEGLQSKVEDADYSKLMVDSKVNENIYQASLSVGAKIISPTLVDFIR